MMAQVLRRSGAGAALLLGAAAAAASAGCTDEETSLFVLGNVVLEEPECIATPSATSTMLISGFLDVALRPEYEASLLVGSQLAPRGDKTNLRTETMVAAITGAEVRLQDDDGDGIEFTVPATGTILPDTSAEPGLGIVNVTLIPAAVGAEIAAELSNAGDVRTRIAEVRVFGQTIGGIEVETSPFTYIIRICEGCLVDFPAGSLDPDFGCIPASADGASTAPCRAGQDAAVSCTLCTGQNPFCTWPGGVAL